MFEGRMMAAEYMAVVNGEGEVKYASRGLVQAVPSMRPGASLSQLIRPSDREAFLRTISLSSEGRLDIRGGPALDGRRLHMVIQPLEGDHRVVAFSMAEWEVEHRPPDLGSFARAVDSAMDRIGSPVVIADQEGRIVQVNRAVEDSTGFRGHELRGRPLHAVFSSREADQERLSDAFDRASRGERVECSIPLMSRDGGVVDQSWRMSTAVVGEMGRVFAAFGRGTLAGRRAADILSLLEDCSADLIEAVDPLEALEDDIARLVDIQGLDFAFFGLQDEEDGLHLLHGISPRVMEVVQRAYRTDEFDHIQVEQFISDWVPGRVEGTEGVESVLRIPMTERGEVLGHALFGGPVEVLDSRRTLLRIICNQVGASFRYYRMMRALSTRTWEFHSLYAASQELNSTLGMDDLVQAVLIMAREMVSARASYLFEREEGKARLLHWDSGEGEVSDMLMARQVSQEVMDLERGMLVRKGDEQDRFGKNSFIAVPLVSGQEFFGVLALHFRTRGFDESSFRMIEMLSTGASLAMRNAVLYERINGIASELRAYNDLLTHDVANYNVPIHGYLEMLLTDPKLDERQRDYVRKALSQSDRISSLVNNVRKLAEIRLTGKEESLREMDLIAVIEKAISEVREKRCREERISLETDLDRAVVKADDMLQDIFVELLENACMHGSDPVEVTVHQSQEGLRVEVVDRGRGVSDELKGRILERFWEDSSDRRAEGKGLGLSVVKALCHRYRGELRVGDREEGSPESGARFTVVLPPNG
ncbi:MAG: ATP-binding protein [Methanomassiliicoccales archaeon]